MKTDQNTTSPNPSQRGYIETVYTLSKTVSCEGNTQNAALGHPRVFLKLKNGQAICPYCSKTFIFKDTADN
ncbi:zinc-finger domain-containing protein [Commensalibacter oyaizuii]|uniref:Zinc-finger domain-containing protein n=1 Tax=Commensalibacter oyaizuii TaxID=3043873 RepID=A0ABT6Q2R4_9PROT|nr:zinc-finger domain-containing protein [Commensalibacter sp. TBRC 16381]MDI2091411.1 zinc-finger domain-containing protein [Commensalibacter sp. TBRC 16381]